LYVQPFKRHPFAISNCSSNIATLKSRTGNKTKVAKPKTEARKTGINDISNQSSITTQTVASILLDASETGF